MIALALSRVKIFIRLAPHFRAVSLRAKLFHFSVHKTEFDEKRDQTLNFSETGAATIDHFPPPLRF